MNEASPLLCAEQVDLNWYTSERGRLVPMAGVYHGARLTTDGRITLVHSHWELKTASLEFGINNGTLVEGADYTVMGVLPDSEHVWVIVASLRAALGDAFMRSRKLVGNIRSARAGWIKDGMLDLNDGGTWIMLANNKRFYDWEARGYFSATVAKFFSVEEFMQVTLDPRAMDVSDLVKIDLKKLLGGLRLSAPVRPRYARRALHSERNAPAVAQELVAAAYPTLSAPGAVAPGLASGAAEPDLPRTRVLAPDGSGYEDPNDSSTWIVPGAIAAAIEEGDRKASQVAATYAPESFAPFDENHPLAIQQRRMLEEAKAKDAQPAQPNVTFWSAPQ